MKVSLLRICSFPIFRKPSLHFHSAFHTPISFSSSSSSIKPKIPLFLRPPTHSIPLSDLKKWYNWAKNLAASVGPSFLHSDNGPDASLLCKELNWLLEDSLEDHSLIPHLGIEESSQNANLRVDLEELYSLWKERIEKRKPLQYLVGCEHWRDLVLCVEEGVFIPRPETELMVDLVSDAIENNEQLREGFWVDLGTGSGAIAIGIGRVLGEQGKVFAIDLNPVACSVAALNVQRYGLQVSEFKICLFF